MALHLSELMTQFKNWHRAELHPDTIAEYDRHFRRMLSIVGDLDVEELRPHHLMCWADTWHRRQAIKRLFHWALVDAELITRNPFRRCKLPRLGQRRRTLTRRNVLRLLRAAHPRFRNFLRCMIESIARPQEVRTLRWEDLVWEGGEEQFAAACLSGQAAFILHEFKGKSRRVDPNAPRVLVVSPRLGALLVRLARGLSSLTGLVFVNVYGEPWTRNALRLQMKRLRRRLGMEADHRGERLVCYTVRHTMATVASGNGIRDKLLAELMGHTSTRTTARYQHLDIDHLRAALRRAGFRAPPSQN